MTISPEILAKYPGDLFIETGTHMGHGVQKALDCGFQEIHSIEEDNSRYQAAEKRFRGHPQVSLYRGASGKVLPTILAQVNRPAIFWLDAHWGGRSSLIIELRAIAQHPIKTHTILIDDLRLLGAWGTNLKQIQTLLLEINPAYNFFREDGCQQADILVALTNRGTTSEGRQSGC